MLNLLYYEEIQGKRVICLPELTGWWLLFRNHMQTNKTLLLLGCYVEYCIFIKSNIEAIIPAILIKMGTFFNGFIRSCIDFKGVMQGRQQ